MAVKRRILFLTKSDTRAASTRYRVAQFVPVLEGAGFRVDLVAPEARGRGPLRLLRRLREERRILRHAREADILFIQKRLLTAGLAGRLERLGKPIIFDFDDALYTSPRGDWSAWTRARALRRLQRVLEASSLVLAGNAVLAEFARAHAPRVEMLPTAIDLSRYSMKVHAHTAGDFTLGWMGSRVNHRYLALLKQPLSRLAGIIPGLRLIVVSDQDMAMAGVKVENRAWSEATETADLLAFDVGLMPLEDDEWTRGKCGLKALQYMAAGIPAVCSAVGANGEILENGKEGFLCRTDDEWYQALHRLAASPDYRTSMGRAGRRRVEQAYSTEIVGARLLALLQTL
ncbi:MAG: glycosyltransferase family 4 protein [Planctomycetes bacterium]|nr:glycosyltransferase family 4 protein [Planctomycetota bacterium]